MSDGQQSRGSARTPGRRCEWDGITSLIMSAMSTSTWRAPDWRGDGPWREVGVISDRLRVDRGSPSYSEELVNVPTAGDFPMHVSGPSAGSRPSKVTHGSARGHREPPLTGVMDGGTPRDVDISASKLKTSGRTVTEAERRNARGHKVPQPGRPASAGTSETPSGISSSEKCTPTRRGTSEGKREGEDQPQPAARKKGRLAACGQRIHGATDDWEDPCPCCPEAKSHAGLRLCSACHRPPNPYGNACVEWGHLSMEGASEAVAFWDGSKGNATFLPHLRRDYQPSMKCLCTKPDCFLSAYRQKVRQGQVRNRQTCQVCGATRTSRWRRAGKEYTSMQHFFHNGAGADRAKRFLARNNVRLSMDSSVCNRCWSYLRNKLGVSSTEVRMHLARLRVSEASGTPETPS
ncbi:unnamed protein product [Ascophyllum nodosum]